MVLLRPILVVAAVVLLPGTAHAFAVCEEEISFDPASAPVAAAASPDSIAAPVDAPADAFEAPPLPAPAGRIVPCAMIESGELGPECADAAFYVVTNAGVLLCTVDLDALTLQQTSTPAVERTPAVPASATGAGLAASALCPDGAKVPPVLFRELASGDLDDDSVPLDRSDRPPVPPS